MTAPTGAAATITAEWAAVATPAAVMVVLAPEALAAGAKVSAADRDGGHLYLVHNKDDPSGPGI